MRRLVPVAVISFLLLAGHANATFPGSNGKLAFDTGPGLYSIATDGSHKRLLARRSYEGAWSPDGSRLLYVHSPRHGKSDIWVMHADGSHKRKIIDDSAYDFDPAWSPDGTTILYVIARFRGEPGRLYAADSDGSHRHRLTRNAANPDWGTGGEIAFDGAGGDFGEGVFTIDPDGGNRQPVPFSGVAFDPSWSPEGINLAFVSDQTNPEHIYTGDPTTGSSTQVSSGDHSDDQPVYSPAGDQIAYTSQGADPIRLVPIIGGPSTTVPHTARGRSVSWQPR